MKSALTPWMRKLTVATGSAHREQGAGRAPALWRFPLSPASPFAGGPAALSLTWLDLVPPAAAAATGVAGCWAWTGLALATVLAADGAPDVVDRLAALVALAALSSGF